MHPEIFNIGPFALRGYGLMLAISFFIGIFYAQRRAVHENINPATIYNMAFIVIIAGIVGARLFYVLFHWQDFSANLLSAINPFAATAQFGISGLNLYGGYVCAILASLVYLLLKRESIWQIFDIFAPAIGLGLFVTRIGCFLNGCCFGIPADYPWCFAFPQSSIPFHQFGSQHLHPAQLYSSLYGLLLFFGLHFYDKKKKFFGATFSLLLISEAIFRYLIEYVRYYEQEMVTNLFGWSLTYNHIIAILLFISGITLFLILSRFNLITRD